MTFKPDWDKSGSRINGTYHGIPYTGIIENSRVKYGGDVEYRVALMDMIEVFGEWRSTVLIDRDGNHGKYQLINN